MLRTAGTQGVSMENSNRPIDALCVNCMRTLSMDAVQKANSGHPGAPMGMAPVAYVLWDRFLRHDPGKPDFPNRDRFVLSMGHASMLLYSTLHLTGYDVSLDDLKSFRQLHAKCAGHPERTLIAGVEATTGPLGQGIANSVGMAVAQRWLSSYFNRPAHEIVDYRVYAMCSDGDLMEGVASEAASLAGHLGLSNLIWIYDSNNISIDGSTSITFSENVAARFQAYGWYVQQVQDANNLDAVHVAIETARAEPRRPSLIVVHSEIGHGSPNRAGKAKAHGEPLGADEVRLTKEVYGWDPDKDFLVPPEVTQHMRDGAVRRGAELTNAWQQRFDAYAGAHPELAAQWRLMQDGALPDGWDRDIPVFDADEKGMATRVSSAKTLEAVARRIPWLIGGSADLVGSTKTLVPDSKLVSKDAHGGRNIAFGVREHAMAALLNGLALSKMRPFGSSFLIFTDYCRPSIRLAALSQLPSIFVFTHDSIGLGEDGPTHQPVEHLASFRAMPNIDVIRPCDANEAAMAWKHILPLTDRPVLLVLSRQNMPTLDRTKFATADGLLRGGYVLADCNGTPDVILIGTGSEVQLCIGARERLSAAGIKARVVSLPCWEQFERQTAAYRESVLPRDVTARVSVEAGSTMGWSRYVGSDGVSIGLDRFGESAPWADVMREFGFTVDNVVEQAGQVVKRNRADTPSRGFQPARTSAPMSARDESRGSKGTRIEQILAVGQSIWCDSISRSMIESGQLQGFVDAGIVGMTSNPSIFQKAISAGKDYDPTIENLVGGGADAAAVYESLVVADVRDAADLLRPVYEATEGVDGYVSLEVNPHLAHDTAGTVSEARHLFKRLDRPNVFIKVPATDEGCPAIETLIGEGINVNVTLIFSLEMYAKVMEAYIRGIERLSAAGGDVSRIASVASFFVSRVDTLVDKKLQTMIDAGQSDLARLLGKAAVGNAKLAYEAYRKVFHGERFAGMRAEGARVQRPLWASTSTKNPSYPDTLYVDTLIGPETVNTLPLNTIDAVQDHGAVEVTIDKEVDAYRRSIADIESAGIAMDAVTAELLAAGVKAFCDAFDQLMRDIKAKMAQLQTA